MKVILNSDVLYAQDLRRDRLPHHLHSFLEACGQNGATVLIPETTLLEFNHQQETLAHAERSKLELSYRLLDAYGIPFERTEPEKLLIVPDLLTLILSTGVRAEILHPNLSDYQEAHRRACLHAPPVPPSSESDEMRDLVIWVLALRVAIANNGAVLLSRDVVHTHARGNDEANAHRLARFSNLDAALEYLGEQGAVGLLVTSILSRVWQQLRDRGLPVGETIARLSVRRSRFVEGQSGPSMAEFTVRVLGQRDRLVQFSAMVEFSGGTVVRVRIGEINDAGQSVGTSEFEITPDLPLEATQQDDFGDRLRALRTVMGGQS